MWLMCNKTPNQILCIRKILSFDGAAHWGGIIAQPMII